MGTPAARDGAGQLDHLRHQAEALVEPLADSLGGDLDPVGGAEQLGEGEVELGDRHRPGLQVDEQALGALVAGEGLADGLARQAAALGPLGEALEDVRGEDAAEVDQERPRHYAASASSASPYFSIARSRREGTWSVGVSCGS